MKIEVIRKEFTENSTIGDLYIDDVWFCYSLEDTDTIGKTGKKIHAQSCIRKGVYKVIINMSNRFKKLMPLLIGVKDFEGIRIHNGNHKDHTEGCILVGMTKGKDFIGMSKIAFKKLMERIEKENNITIEIK